jgi:CRISPR-associated protein Cas6
LETLTRIATQFRRGEHTVTSIAVQPKVDLSFPLRGSHIPADHGYALFSALCRYLPWLHGADDVGVHPIQGRLSGARQLQLEPVSRLTFRLPVDRIGAVLPVAGKRLDIEGAPLLVGVPTVLPLQSKPALRSRLVTIRGFTEPEAFIEAAARHLTELGILAAPQLAVRQAAQSIEGATVRGPGMPIRRTLRIRDKTVVGFALRMTDLTAEESIRLQEAGLGGRRRFGCGLFVAVA